MLHSMALWVTAIGALLLALAVTGLVMPGLFVRRIAGWRGPGLLVFAVGTRVAIAVVLWLAAADCRHPRAVEALAVLAGVAALAGLLMGSDRLGRLVAWWTTQSPGIQRLGFGLAGAMGAFLLYTAS